MSTVQCNLDFLDLVYPAPRLSGLSQAQAMYLCACVEVWLLIFSGCGDYLTKALGTFVGLKMVEMADKDVFMNPFGGLFDLMMPFYINAY